MSELQGKIAFVTGAGRGVGAAISLKLAQLGATVAVTDANAATAEEVSSAITSAGYKAKAYHYDVTSYGAAEALAKVTDDELGGVDILVNNAGVSRLIQFLDIDEKEWDRLMNINLKGVFNTCRAILPGMVARGRGGRVINLGSILSKFGEENFSHYAASKFAVLGLTQAIASEMAHHNITANTVCPGIVYTPLWDGLFEQAVASKAFESEQSVRDFVGNRIPLRRPQTPEDIAEMVAFLASDRARNITGASFHVDGGMTPR